MPNGTKHIRIKRSKTVLWPFRHANKMVKRSKRSQYQLWFIGNVLCVRRWFVTNPARRSQHKVQYVMRVPQIMRWLLGKELAIVLVDKTKNQSKKSRASQSVAQVALASYIVLCLALIGYIITITGNIVTPQPVWAFSLSKIEKPSMQPHAKRHTPNKSSNTITTFKPAYMTRSVPTHVTIESVGINADLSTVGLKTDGSLNVPKDPLQAGWYDASPTPGEQGPAIIDGHVDNYIIGPAVFWRLSQVQFGDIINVNRADGSTARFAVTEVRSYSQADGIPNDVYANTEKATIRLITCGGVFNKSTGHYSDNTVVYGELL